MVLPPLAALVAVAGPGASAHDRGRLRDAMLLDALATAIRVDGAVLSVVADSAATAAEIRPLLPAGVDLILPPDDDPNEPDRLAWTLVELLERGFERVAALLGDTLPPPARVLATALGALGAADLVVGATPSGGIALVGSRDPAAAALIGSNAAGTANADIVRAARASGFVVRTLERASRLSELSDPDALATLVIAEPERVPRLAALVAGRVAREPRPLGREPSAHGTPPSEA